MIARRSVWTDATVKKLLEDFIPVGDEVWRLHNLKDPDCLHFQGYCFEGHYPRDNSTMQGTWCCTPSGKLLGSINSRSPAEIANLLRTSLEKYKAMKKEDRLLKDDPALKSKDINRNEKHYPKNGMVLRVHSRDLPRGKGKEGNPSDWRTHALNLDYAWFKKEEMEKLFPPVVQKKAEYELPKDLVTRLCRIHLADNVRGQTSSYPADGVKEIALKGLVTKVAKGIASIELQGTVKLEQGERGFTGKLRGEAEYDSVNKMFKKFELVAAGDRWGRTAYNAREDDVEKAPIGFVFTLAPDTLSDKLAPAEFGAYGWR